MRFLSPGPNLASKAPHRSPFLAIEQVVCQFCAHPSSKATPVATNLRDDISGMRRDGERIQVGHAPQDSNRRLAAVGVPFSRLGDQIIDITTIPEHGHGAF
jgi:hypothetical protein